MGANPNGKLAEHNNALMMISPLAEDNWMLKRGGYHNHYFFCPCSAANNNPRGTHPHLVGFFCRGSLLDPETPSLVEQD